MTKVYVVRHGETEWNRLGRLQGVTNIQLNAQGILQAEKCGKYFDNLPIAAIVTSPLLRAKKTAQIINEDKQLLMIECEQFKEKTFGEAEGMTYEQRLKKYPTKDYPNQESFIDFQQRLLLGLDLIERRFPGDEVILITHGAVIHSLFRLVKNKNFFPQHARLSNGGISTMIFKDGHWWLEKYNETTHLL